MEWQPIETAPKDGNDMLIVTHWKDIYVGYWDLMDERFMESEYVVIYEPTHWMPIPKPPVQE